MSSPGIDDIAARLRRLEDERAIVHTLYRYGHALDYGREDDWADCFTDDGVFEVLLRDGETFSRVAGRDELLGFARAHTRAPVAYHKHFVADPMIELDGEAARADSYFARVDGQEAGQNACIVAMGRYRDRLVRCPDGVWRLRHRLAELQNL